MTAGEAVPAAVEQAHRAHWGRIMAGVAKACGGDLRLAEDATAEAFVAALETWPRDGVPDSPGGWLAVTARRRALDRLRRDLVHDNKIIELERSLALSGDGAAHGVIPDERLELVFGCCHPALAVPSQVALTLRCASGLSTAEIARAFLVPESTMAQRLSRARNKVRIAGIPLRVPGPTELPDRLPAVLTVVYLIYNEGYAASAGDLPVRDGLCRRAVDLAEVLAGLLPEQPDVQALLALLLLQESRRPARRDAAGELILLADQDRSRWDRTLVDRAEALLRAMPARTRGHRYACEATIALVHAGAPTYADTDWPAVVTVYRRLLAVHDTPVGRLNHAVAVGLSGEVGAALGLLANLTEVLGRYHYFHAARADFLRRAGDRNAAAAATRTALELVGNQAERRLLQRRLDDLTG